ncbi:orotidine-5'-phosphate decarboxylase [Brevibacterium daeguense]|uniref:Orotidine-5'-phosphate decarboxylase n=1 Tax=Brevibacterium daeguense TaxID=909936 RepID=A0ABP8EN97_9MICO|nr:orotidine-5'-phosphate decarboxylase [Brevibacterium daeguense]
MRDYSRSWVAAARTSALVVGIDPSAGMLHHWGLPDTAAGARELSLRVLEAAAGRVGTVKPQSAFFERFGSAGIAVLEEVLAEARQTGLLTILDIKRGDIGSTMAGYADAYMNPSSPLCADAVTLSPYLGFGSLAPALEAARRWGTGCFVLALTSNPEGAQVQHATTSGGSAVAAEVVAGVEAFNAEVGSPLAGVVIGATAGETAKYLGMDPAGLQCPILAPGFGAQGATVDDLERVFGDSFRSGRVLVNASRSVLSHGPDRTALQVTMDEISRVLGQRLRLD